MKSWDRYVRLCIVSQFAYAACRNATANVINARITLHEKMAASHLLGDDEWLVDMKRGLAPQHRAASAMSGAWSSSALPAPPRARHRASTVTCAGHAVCRVRQAK